MLQYWRIGVPIQIPIYPLVIKQGCYVTEVPEFEIRYLTYDHSFSNHSKLSMVLNECAQFGFLLKLT